MCPQFTKVPMKLNDAKLRTIKELGKHFDGGGLYLEITPAGGRYWRLKYRFGGKEKRLCWARKVISCVVSDRSRFG